MQGKISGTAASIALLAGMILANLAAAQTPELTAAQRRAKQDVEDRLAAVLAKPYAGRFEETPLEDVLASISRTTGLPIRVDAETLDDASIYIETPVHFAVPGVSLRSALTMMLDPIDLTWVIRDGSVLVTTPEKASELLVLKVYPVQDLVAAADPTNPRAVDYQPIIETIKKSIGSSLWEDVGGPGAIGKFTTPGSLVVSQTFAAHEKTALLLAALRKARDRQHLAQAAPHQTEPLGQQALSRSPSGPRPSKRPKTAFARFSKNPTPQSSPRSRWPRSWTRSRVPPACRFSSIAKVFPMPRSRSILRSPASCRRYRCVRPST